MTDKLKSALLKLCGILFFILLILCFLNPIFKARDRKVDDYRDFYRYQFTARNYYHAVHSSVYNLNALVADMKVKGPFYTLTHRDDVLTTDEELTNRVFYLYATLETIPDPGSRGLIRAVRNCHEAYVNYYNLLFSGQYDQPDFFEKLEDARRELRDAERDLFDEAYEE